MARFSVELVHLPQLVPTGELLIQQCIQLQFVPRMILCWAGGLPELG